MRLIDADKLKAEFKKMENYHSLKLPYDVVIDNAPTVEPKKEIVPVCKVTFDKEQLQEIVNKKVAEMIERPQGEWISVNEKLPERYKEVIVTDIETSGTYVSRYIGNGYWECDNGPYKHRIIAWQPLPEPYMRGEENETD